MYKLFSEPTLEEHATQDDCPRVKRISELSTSASFSIRPCALSHNHRKAKFYGKFMAPESERTYRCYRGNPRNRK